ncbi:hypothetical protein [Mycobacterium paraseoulense]|uniref:hypothetical protein n=1 Tax=Mycobacterium paraseoulense TaxID=590652 RepID=UPI001301AFD2|nr:hypothetical protein [Mycobacterium paraseoulense]MCV7394393.1 hypothetical protein [Mycobacterium paraseoulense]BBZ74157.1 hypothetical protein MPRS_52500 [Mycobacterium paraseoulense]
MAKVEVRQEFQCVHEGEVFDSGDTADVPEAVAQRWLTEGWASEVAQQERSPKRR